VEWSERTGELKLTIYQFAQHEATIQYEERRKQAKYCHVQRDQEAGGEWGGQKERGRGRVGHKNTAAKGEKGDKVRTSGGSNGGFRYNKVDHGGLKGVKN